VPLKTRPLHHAKRAFGSPPPPCPCNRQTSARNPSLAPMFFTSGLVALESSGGSWSPSHSNGSTRVRGAECPAELGESGLRSPCSRAQEVHLAGAARWPQFQGRCRVGRRGFGLACGQRAVGPARTTHQTAAGAQVTPQTTTRSFTPQRPWTGHILPPRQTFTSRGFLQDLGSYGGASVKGQR
jgi:hypothetical protein